MTIIDFLKFCNMKRTFEGTHKMVVQQMENALNEIAINAEKFLSEYESEAK